MYVFVGDSGTPEGKYIRVELRVGLQRVFLRDVVFSEAWDSFLLQRLLDQLLRGVCLLGDTEKVMASKMDNFQISLLKQFVDLCKQKPDLLHSPQLKFFKDWLEK